MICGDCRNPHEGRPKGCPDCGCQHKGHVQLTELKPEPKVWGCNVCGQVFVKDEGCNCEEHDEVHWYPIPGDWFEK